MVTGSVVVERGPGRDYVPPPMVRPFTHLSHAVWLAGCTALALLAACDLKGVGEPPPRGKLYYPTGMAVTQDGSHLLVANANFNRRYSHGSVQSFDIAAIAKHIDERCSGDAAGIDCELTPSDVLTDEVLIASLARSAALSADGKRLYVPTHANSALAYVDVGSDGSLDCGGHRTCEDSFRREGLPSDAVALRSVSLPDLGSSKAGDAVAIAHRGGQLSLLVHLADSTTAPELVHVYEGLSTRVTGLDYDADSGLFHVTSEQASTAGLKFLQRVGVDVGDDPSAAYAFGAGTATLRGIAQGQDTWAVRFGASAEADQALVVTQRPDALLQVSFAADGLSANVRNLVEVGGRASRLAVATLQGDGMSRTLAIVSCYGERRIFVVDVDSGEVVSIVPGLSGPFEMAVDNSRGLVFIADFDSSTVRILDLSPILERGSARIVATLGTPQALEELQ